MSRHWILVACLMATSCLPLKKDLRTAASNNGKKDPQNQADSHENQFIDLMPEKFADAAFSSKQICDTGKSLTPSDSLTLSPAFLNNCSGCHGSSGEGYVEHNAPSLRNLASLDGFRAVIRSGRGKMPAFSKNLLSDGNIESDFNLLKNSSANLKQTSTMDVPISAPETISDAEYKKIMNKGLLAWRTAGSRGACATCHGPDGIDLARVAFSNSAILRRSMGQGLPPEQGLDIVKMISAQRSRFQINEPCNVGNFRPLHPGFKTLSGANEEEKDLQLLKELSQRGVNFEHIINNYQTAKSLMDSILNLNIREVPIAIALTRWAEDGFHGKEHKSTAEWLPELPMEATSSANQKKWIELQNLYLQSYSARDLWNLVDGIELLSAHRFSDGGVGERLAKEKYRSVLVMQHLLRAGDLTFPDLGVTKNKNRFSVWEAAQIATVMTRGCADSGTKDDPFPCWDYPASFFEKMGSDAAFLLTDLKKIILPWLLAGFMQDPDLGLTEGGDAQMQHLHNAFHGSALADAVPGTVDRDLFIHNIYFSIARLVKSVEKTGCWENVNSGMQQWVEATLPSLKIYGLLDPAQFKDPAYRTQIVQIIHNLDLMLLNVVLNGVTQPKSECQKSKTNLKLSEWIDALVTFETEMQTGNSEIILLANKIKALHP